MKKNIWFLQFLPVSTIITILIQKYTYLPISMVSTRNDFQCNAQYENVHVIMISEIYRVIESPSKGVNIPTNPLKIYKLSGREGSKIERNKLLQYRECVRNSVTFCKRMSGTLSRCNASSGACHVKISENFRKFKKLHQARACCFFRPRAT